MAFREWQCEDCDFVTSDLELLEDHEFEKDHSGYLNEY